MANRLRRPPDKSKLAASRMFLASKSMNVSMGEQESERMQSDTCRDYGPSIRLEDGHHVNLFDENASSEEEIEEQENRPPPASQATTPVQSARKQPMPSNRS